MLTIRCGRCKAKVLKYNKIGQGRVLRCYYKRIKENNGLLEEEKLKCHQCGNTLGILKGGHIAMDQKEFKSSGKKIRT